MATRKSAAKPADQKKGLLGEKLPYETIALVLQGGGALGSYQAGVYEGLNAAGIRPNWIAGISIGALNAAIIAGNAPEERVAKLREFWETICSPAFGLPGMSTDELEDDTPYRKLSGAWLAWRSILGGQNGFFVPRMPPPMPGSLAHDPLSASYYDTAPLKATLLRLADFDRINDGGVHVTVGAVNVATANFAYFDNRQEKLRPEHFMASGSLPPGFPPVEIDGELYWDGGLVSNTPLLPVIAARPYRDTLAFQVDLWSAQGQVPGNIDEVASRQKDIQFSSRTRMVTDMLRKEQAQRKLVCDLLERIPEKIRKTDPLCLEAAAFANGSRYNVIHLIYRSRQYESHYKDYQFGQVTMREHWASGLDDIQRTLAHPEWLEAPEAGGFVTHDVHRHIRQP